MKKATLTAKEVSQLLGVSSQKIYEMCRMKQIPHVKIGSRFIFHENALADWMNISNITPRGPLLTPLPTERFGNDYSGTYELRLSGETVRFIQTILEIQEADIKRGLDEAFEESTTKSIYYKERPDDLYKRQTYAQRRYHALIVAMDEIDREYYRVRQEQNV
ncbi:UNVERIFIED_CONTAM: excisionase family DNA binding protein [Brevibacillus sp. OAP136]